MKKLFFGIFLLFTLLICSQKVTAQQTTKRDLSKNELINAYEKDDSSKAIINLFYRKRNWAMWRIIIGGGLAGYSAGTALASDNPKSAIVGPLVFAPLYITGITSSNKYKQETLLQILEKKKEGIPFPRKYRKKLQDKDFAL